MTAKTENAKTQDAMRRRAAERGISVPLDREPLARWHGDGMALLARLQENCRDLWLMQDVTELPALELHSSVAKLIRAVRDHFEEMPR